MADFQFGFHSEAQEAAQGHFLYTTPAGNRVKVTMVRASELIEEPRALWPDIRYIGQVVHCLGIGWLPGRAAAAAVLVASGGGGGGGR